MHSIGCSSTKTPFRLAQNRTALFLCRFCRRTSAKHTNVDYGAGTDGGHGRPLCQRCTTGTHCRHRSGSYRLESILSEYANIAYWGIVALLMIRLIMQLAGIIRLACRCRKIQIGNTSIHLLPKADGPFSFSTGFLSIRPRIRKRNSTKY